MNNFAVSFADDTIRVNKSYRCNLVEIIDYITNLELLIPPYNEPIFSSGTIQELEQHLHSKFNQYTFGFKQKYKPDFVLSSQIQGLTFKVDDDYTYIYETIRQHNLYLLSISSHTSLITKSTGSQSYLILKLITTDKNKVKFIEVVENYV